MNNFVLHLNLKSNVKSKKKLQQFHVNPYYSGNIYLPHDFIE